MPNIVPINAATAPFAGRSDARQRELILNCIFHRADQPGEVVLDDCQIDVTVSVTEHVAHPAEGVQVYQEDIAFPTPRTVPAIRSSIV